MNTERVTSRRTFGAELRDAAWKFVAATAIGTTVLEFGIILFDREQQRQQKLGKFRDTMQNISVASADFYPHFEAPLAEIGDYGNLRLDRGNLLDVIEKDYPLREKAFLAVYRAALPLIKANSAALVKNTVSPAPLSLQEIDQLATITAYAGSTEGPTFILDSIDSVEGEVNDGSIISDTYRDYSDKGKIKSSDLFSLFLQRLEQAKLDIINHRIPGV